MGWFGYGIYDGDDTQSCHYDFIKWAGIKKSNDIVSDWIAIRGTFIPDEYLSKFKSGLSKVVDKMPKVKYWNEDNALEWQMLAALLLDNKIKNKQIIKRGIEATDYLIEEGCEDFNSPGRRRTALRKFKKKLEDFIK